MRPARSPRSMAARASVSSSCSASSALRCSAYVSGPFWRLGVMSTNGGRHHGLAALPPVVPVICDGRPAARATASRRCSDCTRGLPEASSALHQRLAQVQAIASGSSVRWCARGGASTSSGISVAPPGSAAVRPHRAAAWRPWLALSASLGRFFQRAALGEAQHLVAQHAVVVAASCRRWLVARWSRRSAPAWPQALQLDGRGLCLRFLLMLLLLPDVPAGSRPRARPQRPAAATSARVRGAGGVSRGFRQTSPVRVRQAARHSITVADHSGRDPRPCCSLPGR